MNKKHKKSIRSMIQSHNKSIKDKTHVLIECILKKDPLSANKIFPGLVSEAEALRELEVKKLLLQDDEDWGDDEGGDDEGDDTGDDEGGDDEGDDTGDNEGGDDEGDGQEDDTADDDTNKIIDDATEIKCQINAKVIEQLFDVISDLKNTLNNKELDETSKEFIVLDTTISYYSDKLQELQAQTNPGTDQTKLEEKLDTISKALDELKEKAGDSSSDEDDVEAPEDVDDSQQGDQDQSDQDEDTDEGDQEGDQEDEDQDEGDQEDEDQDEEQQSDEDF